jgi:hypothetical protein
VERHREGPSAAERTRLGSRVWPSLPLLQHLLRGSPLQPLISGGTAPGSRAGPLPPGKLQRKPSITPCPRCSLVGPCGSGQSPVPTRPAALPTPCRLPTVLPGALAA